MARSNKSVWISGEICEAPGVYFSDTCGHSIRKEFLPNDIFSRCPTCHLAIRWMRFGSTFKWDANPRPDIGTPKPRQKT